MSYADRYDPDVDVDRWFTDATARSIVNWIRPGDRVLELGCATGRMTAALSGAGATVVAVDREAGYLATAATRGLQGVEWHHAGIEQWLESPRDAGFDHVVLANVVHELEQPSDVVTLARQVMSSWGHVHVTLQNPSSLHRLVGLAIGAITDLCEVSARGSEFETLRLYDLAGLRAIGHRAGLVDIHHEGIMLKPLANEALGRLDDAVLEGFVQAGRLAPDFAAMNYVIFGERRGG